MSSGVVSRSARKAARRNELLDVAWRVVDREGERVAMEQIAEAAGITRPILYRHFADTDGLYLALGERFAGELRAAFPHLEARSGRDLLEGMIEGFLATVEAHPGVYRYLTRRTVDAPSGTDEAVRDFVSELAGYVEDHLRSLGLEAATARLWARCLIGAIRAAGELLLEDDSLAKPHLVTTTADLLWPGLARAPLAGRARPQPGARTSARRARA